MLLSQCEIIEMDVKCHASLLQPFNNSPSSFGRTIYCPTSSNRCHGWKYFTSHNVHFHDLNPGPVLVLCNQPLCHL